MTTSNNTAPPLNKRLISLIAFFIVPISGLGTDIYVPSLPAVTQHFHVDESLVQLSITAYMLGIGLMQLFAGGITDSFGRKKPILYAMLFFVLASFCIPVVSNMYQLLALRLFQGITIAIAVVPNRSLIADIYTGKEFLKMFNYMTVSWSIGPIIAPFIGGYLQHYFGWEASFYFLTIYSIIAFILVFLFIPETSIHRHPFSVIELCKRYMTMITCGAYIRPVILNGLLYSINIIFSVVSPFIIQLVLHYSSIQFGHVVLMTGFAWFVGTITNRFILHITIRKKTLVCLSLMLIVSIAMLITSLALPMSVATIVTPVICLALLGGIIFPNNFSQSIALFPKSTGSANALGGSLVYLVTSISSALSLNLSFTSAVPLSLAYVGLIMCCLVIAINNN